ncbi:MAG: helix-turn-helix domain-containing protein, partial [Candidatus Zixiibacteriota bacterium]
LEKSVQQGHFREDLYYRLNVIPILIPPLRNRKEDIPLLAAHFLKKYNQEDDKKIKGLSREAMNQILTYSWPGNVRELENAIRRAVVLCEEEVITLKDLPPNVRLISANSEEELSQITCEENSLSSNICALEKHLILKALGKTQGNISKAASVLGITYRCLRYKIQKYNLENMPQRLRKNSSRKPLPQDS